MSQPLRSSRYCVLGADGQPYGPVTLDELRLWILEGRVNGRSHGQREGETRTWRPLTSFTEVALLLPPMNPAIEPVSISPSTDEDLLRRRSHLCLLNEVRDAWRVIAQSKMSVVGPAAVVMALSLLLLSLAVVPWGAVLSTLVFLIAGGPVIGGICHLFVRANRGQDVTGTDLFGGFGAARYPLMIVLLVQAIFLIVALTPGLALLGLGLAWDADRGTDGIALALQGSGAIIIVIVAGTVGILWGFAYELVMDRKMDFWGAMELSRRVASRHFLQLMGFLLIAVCLMAVGVAAFVVGIFVTFPWVLAMYARVYEELFGGPHVARA